jgi:hypothetical protein
MKKMQDKNTKLNAGLSGKKQHLTERRLSSAAN